MVDEKPLITDKKENRIKQPWHAPVLRTAEIKFDTAQTTGSVTDGLGVSSLNISN